MIANSWIYN